VLAPLLSSNVRSIVGNLVTSHAPVIIVGLALGLLILGPILAVYRKIRYYPPLKKQQLDFTQLKRELCFIYQNDRRTFVYHRSITLKPLRAGLSTYKNKFMWTGKTLPRIVCDTKRHQLNLLDRKGVWQYYEINFGRALNLTETETTVLTFTMIDPEHTFTPFISATIDEPTDELKMKLHIPPEFGVTEATCEFSYNMGANVPCETRLLNLDHDGWLEWPIEKPRMHHYYELRWKKPDVFSIPRGAA
jgi:hypothetical protein